MKAPTTTASAFDAWFAYPYWHDDARAPDFARTVDIHRKPGYDPVELFFDPATKSVPLDASRVRGSHGAPVMNPTQKTVAVASRPDVFSGEAIRDVDVFQAVLRQFGLE